MPAVAHEHVIGEIIDYESTRLVTLSSLRAHIDAEHELRAAARRDGLISLLERWPRVYTLADYCDGRRNTDLHRFNFCPECGQKINWRAIKEERS